MHKHSTVILLGILVVFLSAFILWQGKMQQREPSPLQTAPQSVSAEKTSYRYVYRTEPNEPNYFQVLFSYHKGDFTTIKHNDSLIFTFGAKTGGRGEGSVTVTNMNLAADFCSNPKYSEEKAKLFPSAAGFPTPLCVSSNPDGNFTISEALLDNPLNNNNLHATMGSYPPALMLPMVIGKFYVQIHVYGPENSLDSADEQKAAIVKADLILKEVAKDFIFNPYFSQ